jgi:hypothetical protein
MRRKRRTRSFTAISAELRIPDTLPFVATVGTFTHGPLKYHARSKAALLFVEQWFWIALRIICGVALCIGRVLPTSGAALNAAVLGDRRRP